MFFLRFTTPVSALLPKHKILFEHARRLGKRDYLTSSTQLVSWFTTWMNEEFVEKLNLI